MKRLFLVCFLVFWKAVGYSQTHPTPQQVPMSQDFGNNWFTSSGLPAGTSVWKVSGAPSATLAAAASSNPNGDENTFDSATVVKSPGKAYGYSAIGTGNINVNNGQLYIQTSSSANGTDQLILAVKSTGFTNLKVSFEVEMINPQPKKTGIVFQYRIGTSGSWTTVDSTYHHNSSDKIQNQIDYFVNLPLGSSADNQGTIELRWAFSRDVNPAGFGSCGLAIDNIVVSADPLTPPQYFRSIASGNWNSLSTWESSLDGITWAGATAPPTTGDLSVIIQAPHVVNTSGINNLVIDELTINSGAMFWNAWGTALAIEDGPSAADLQVNGSFLDSSNVSVVWVNTARWQLGATGTYIKTYNTNSTSWQLKYYNGIATIPATSNWICRKAAGSNVEPRISTTNGGPPNPQAVYGNLYIENNSGSWNSNNLCKFSGSNNVPLIKGNLYVGGNGSGNVSFLYSNTYSSALKVVGDIVIVSGSTLRNEGTGVEVQGNMICNGTHSYGSSTSYLLFSGSNIQTVSGIGSISVYRMDVNKTSNDLSLSNSINIFGLIKMVSGNINTTSSSTINIQNNATANSFSNSSFVRGPMKKTGNNAFIFPVGKGNLLRTIGMDVGAASTSDVFLAEYFYQNPQAVYGNVVDPSLDHISSCEYWTLDQLNGNSQKKVTLSWSTNSCGVSGMSDLRVARYNGALWYNEGASASSGTNSAGTVTSNTTTGFGPFTLASTTSLNPLPIELISFDAQAKTDHVELTWITATEINNDYFTVERSRDGIQFSPIGIMKGAGNSTQAISYDLNDENPLTGISYYRLKQTDYDGKYSYSNIVAVKMKATSFQLISVSPQKEFNTLDVKMSFAKPAMVRLIIQDLNGKIVSDNNFKVEGQILSLPLIVNMNSGVYFIRAFSDDQVAVDKFFY